MIYNDLFLLHNAKYKTLVAMAAHNMMFHVNNNFIFHVISNILDPSNNFLLLQFILASKGLTVRGMCVVYVNANYFQFYYYYYSQ